MSEKNSTNLRQTKGGGVIKQGDSSSIFEYELLDYDGNKYSSLDGKNAKIKIANAKGKKTIETLENRPQAHPETVDLTNYLTSDKSYQTFVTYSALQSQMTTNIKEKHLELGIDALIDEKLKNGGDSFITGHQAENIFASKQELAAIVSRVQALENKA